MSARRAGKTKQGAAPASPVSLQRQRTRPCPICRNASTPDFHPFCSKHCADVDLNRWLTGGYAIPAVEPPDDWSEGGEPEE